MKALSWLLAGAALAGILAFTRGSAPTRWEYTVYIPSNTDPDLNARGAQGWELVQAMPGGANGYGIYFFKRPLP